MDQAMKVFQIGAAGGVGVPLTQLLVARGDGLVTAGLAIEYGDVRRENVAALIDAILHAPQVSRTIIEVTDGATPAADALASL